MISYKDKFKEEELDFLELDDILGEEDLYLLEEELFYTNKQNNKEDYNEND